MPRCLAIIALALALPACGLKGDLYLPPEPPPVPAPAAEPAATDEAGAPAQDDAGDTRRQVPPSPDRGQAL